MTAFKKGKGNKAFPLKAESIRRAGKFIAIEIRQRKKQAIMAVPYIAISLFATNLGEAGRMVSGRNASEQMMSFMVTLPEAFQNPLPSLHPLDLLTGACAGVLLRIFVYLKAKDAKKFLIIGNMNAIKYKETFPLIKTNKMWLGATGNGTDMVFGVPETAIISQHDRDKAAKMGYVGNYTRLGNSCWFTNLEHGRRHQPLQLMSERENIKFSKHKEVRGVGYHRYINFDGIEVPFVDAIPCDFDGVMGVPISFLDKFCPEQFEIVGMSLDLAEARDEIRDWYLARPEEKQKRTGNDTFYYRDDNGNPVRLYDRLAIRFRRSK